MLDPELRPHILTFFDAKNQSWDAKNVIQINGLKGLIGVILPLDTLRAF
jgi:hypothetical protein